jgi:hypothetical protein
VSSPTFPLNRIRIESPCAADWESMQGSDRVRFCEHCALSVHNISQMTTEEAARLVAASQGRLCIRYYRRTDGTILTDMPARLHKITRRASRLAAGAFSAALSLASTALAQTPAPSLPRQDSNVAAQARRANDLPANVAGGQGGWITGVVTDPTGAAIPGATLTLTNEATKAQLVARTNDDGSFSFQSLEAGAYKLEIKAEGFNSSERPVDIEANAEQRVEHTLELPEGTLIETATVGIMIIAEPSNALVRAVWKEDLEAVKELLRTGSDVNVVDDALDITPLSEAALKGNLEMMRLLLDAGAEVNLRNRKKQTALMLMMTEQTSVEAVRVLLSAGAKVNRKDEYGATALGYAASLAGADVVQALIDAGAKINSKNNTGQTPLMAAAESGRVESVRALLVAGADIDRKDEDGDTALKLALDAEYAEVVSLLRAYGAVEEQ